ncbi:MAG: discoidin domain-containing protein [Candidatus Omnitrophica bacterium]|nr:discoidin domain-containing protein [Candidatus Omnitrophota bacterium]
MLRSPSSSRGSVLIMALAVVILLVSLTGGFLYAVGVFTLNSGWEETDAKALWLAEAGLQKGIWNLKTPSGNGGQGEDWTTAGTTETLGEGSYTMVVARWDFALAANGATVSASSSISGREPANAIDGDDSTYWQSATKPTPDEPDKPPQEIIVTFPYPLTLNKVRFLVPSGSPPQAPKDYAWQVSTDGTSYTTAVTVTHNSILDRTDTFSAQSDVNYLKLRVTKINGGSIGVRIATLEAIGSKITSAGSITASGNTTSRTVSQTVVADDASPQSQVAYVEPDWVEQ